MLLLCVQTWLSCDAHVEPGTSQQSQVERNDHVVRGPVILYVDDQWHTNTARASVREVTITTKRFQAEANVFSNAFFLAVRRLFLFFKH